MAIPIACSILLVVCLAQLTTGRTLTGVKGGRPRGVSPLDPDVLRVAEVNNHFALEVYRLLSQSTPRAENLAFCPISLTSLVSMLYLGATGNTAAEINATLGYYSTGLNEEQLSEGFRKATEVLVAGTNGSADFRSTLRLANSVWIQKTQGYIERAFVDDLLRYFKAMVMEVDFRDPNTRKEINKWANDATEGLIENILERNLPATTKIMLASAIYFTSKWEMQFNSSLTRSQLFRNGGSRLSYVPMMQGRFPRVRYGYSQALKAQAFELPYQGRQTSMLVILPDDQISIQSIEGQLNPETIVEVITTMSPYTMNLSMPRFEVHKTHQLRDTLSGVGIPSLFSPSGAQLEGIDARGGLYVSDVLQKVVVKVDEEGTKAAAVTASVTNRQRPKEISVTLDRPFLFLIGHVQTGAILFMGRVAQP